MDFGMLLRRAGKTVSDNSPAILTASAVVGVFATAYLTGRATIKAIELIREDEAVGGTAGDPLQRLRERAHLTWREFIPPVTIGACTIACVVFANRIEARRTAAALAAFALSEKAFDHYKEKVVEKIGENKERKYRDEIAQERVSREPCLEDAILLEDGVSVLCMDLYTGRPFLSDMESLRRAENDINFQVNHNFYASLSDFYERIGLPRTTMSDDFGWNADRLLELEFSHALTPTGKPCLTIDFRVAPIRGYNRLQ